MKFEARITKARNSTSSLATILPLHRRGGEGRGEGAANFQLSTFNFQRTAAFTLAEVLAALLFMAIVIPVALEGMHVASRAGSVAVRKREAARVAERLLNESIITTNWSNGSS